MRVLVTGSRGLIGSEAVRFFDRLGFPVTGIDNNLRADFFGPMGDTTATLRLLERTCPAFRHLDLDIRDRQGKENAAGLPEWFDRIAEKTGKRPRLTMTSENRIYYSDLRRLRSHFPSWDPAYSLDRVIEDSIDSASDKQAA